MLTQVILRFPDNGKHYDRPITIDMGKNKKEILENAVKLHLQTSMVHPKTGVVKEFKIEFERFVRLESKIIAMVSESSAKEIHDFLRGTIRGI